MKSRNNSGNGPKAGPQPNATQLERLTTYFKTVFLTLSIEREIDQELKRFSKAAQVKAANALKKPLPRRSRSTTKGPKTSKKPVGKSLPKLLTAQALPKPSTNLFNFYSKTKLQLARIERIFWRCLIPDQEDLAMIAEQELRNHSLKADACQRLINDARSKVRNIRSRTHLQKLRLAILEISLVSLENEGLEKEVELQKRQAAAFALRMKRVDNIIRNSGRTLEAAEIAIAKVEKKAVKSHERLEKALEMNGGLAMLSQTIFVPIEQKVQLSEELAKASIEKFAKLPAVKTKCMSVEQLKNAISVFDLATKELEICWTSLACGEADAKVELADLNAQRIVWQVRQEKAELQENEELAKQAKQRLIGVLEAALQNIKSIEDNRTIKESVQQRLDELNLVTAKLAERLAESEQATN